MELTFNKVGKRYEAEFELAADANLHIEFESAAPVKLYQRTTGGGWDLCNDAKNEVGKAIDVDLTALIYPKFIKIVSEVKPTYASIVSSGEITEIKSQAKSIEITSNGTTSVEPDAGFSYLSKVDVKVDVPMSGGSGGAGLKYYDVFDLYSSSKGVIVGLLAALVKIKSEGVIVGGGYFETSNVGSSIVDAVAIIPDALITPQAGGTARRAEDVIKEIAPEIVEITESEFYNLDKATIEFTIDGISYQAEEGMTWQEFVESSYNNGEFSIGTYVVHNGQYVADQDGERVVPSDAIVGNYDYIYYEK